MTIYCHYLRVSTAKQGADGYGVNAQRAALSKYVPAVEFVEVESGRRNDRPELIKALDYCKKNKATLVVAKLDRLARCVRLISQIMDSGVELIVADSPDVTRLTLHVLSAVAEAEAVAISSRTKAGLAVAKTKGVKLGKSMSTDKQAKGRATLSVIADRNAAMVGRTIQSHHANGLSLRGIATELNLMGVTTPRGKQWTATAVRNALARVA